ncbi:MAG: hypothetical protein QOK28_3393 [Actinomycetota bacterium]|jgi:hypothetical protein
MAKGKHSQAADRRRAADELDRLAAACRRFSDETVRYAAAAAAAAEVDDLAARIRRAERIQQANAADELSRTRQVAEELRVAVEDEERLAATITAAWRRVQPMLQSAFGSGIEGAEDFIDATSPGASVGGRLEWGVAHSKNMNATTTAALQRAKGLRRRTPGRVTPRARREAADGWALFKPVGFMADRWVATQLGCLDGDADELAAWAAAGTVPDHAGVAHADAVEAPTDKRWANPYMPTPLFPRPSDAAALRYWYAALAADVGRALPAVAAKDTEEELAGVQAAAEAWDSAADLAATAAIYWLPPGQAAGYAASQPLSSEDLDEVRMPFRSTMIVPAEPLVIDAADTPVTYADDDGAYGEDEDADSVLRDGIEYARRSVINAHTTPDGGVTSGQTPLDVAASRLGMHIEAIVVEADRTGCPSRRLLVCVAVPAPDGSAVLCRYALPAWKDRASAGFAAAVDQLCAAVAWGAWVETTADDADDGHEPVVGPRRAPAPALHVLDVAATDGNGDASGGEPTGRHVAPHTRRGHWRRQHHGPGNTLVKRVRIAPTLVNAGQGPLSPRVYRIRPAAPNVDDAPVTAGELVDG